MLPPELFRVQCRFQLVIDQLIGVIPVIRENLYAVSVKMLPDGGGTGSGQRLWGPVPGKPGPDGRNISSKKYLFDELTKNSGKKSAIPLL